MNNLNTTSKELVRLLPLGAPMKPKICATDYTWTHLQDFREICSCQVHARRERTLWRRTLRGAKRRGVALLVTVPLAFGAIGMEAMNVSLPAFAKQAIEISGGSRPFRIFTTRKVRGKRGVLPDASTVRLDHLSRSGEERAVA